jgi:hypothetical protein
MQSGERLDVQLDRGEPEEMVIPGLRDEGHLVETTMVEPSWVGLTVTCGG